jgi:hypothetical protein
MKSHGIEEMFTVENGNTFSRWRARDEMNRLCSVAGAAEESWHQVEASKKWLQLKEDSADDIVPGYRLCGSAEGAVRSRLRIVAQGEAQNAFAFNWLRRARDVVKRAGAERFHISIPIGQAGNDNHGNTARRCGQNLQRGSQIAIRQIISAKDKLKRLLPNQSARIAQRRAKHMLQPNVAHDFSCLVSVRWIGTDD